MNFEIQRTLTQIKDTVAKTDRMLIRRIRLVTLFMILAIAFSGITAVPVEWELKVAIQHLESYPDPLRTWLLAVNEGVTHAGGNYPFLLYGNDWLAFGHIVIAMGFIGLLKEPIRNAWLADWGIMACLAVIPTAFLMGWYREIPLFWRLIDCSFGVFGLLPLLYLKSLITQLNQVTNKTKIQ